MARHRPVDPVRVLRVHDPAGGPALWVALSRSHPDAGYLLREGRDGRWLCSCPRFAYRGACPHVEALYARVTPASGAATGARA